MSQEVTAEHLKLMADKGMTVTTPDPKFRAELEPIGATLTAEWLKKAGPAGEQIIAAYRKQ
jgi:TRAP-type C4-dicarboxylate transport system substrate-binding protein